MWLSLNGLGTTMEHASVIADTSRASSDYKNNLRIASRDEIYGMLLQSSDSHRKGYNYA